jgi:hypothetical protein
VTFALPLSREEFAAALVTGHGRALMHVERHGLGAFVDELLRACVTDYVLDGQTEERRAAWLARLVVATGDAAAWGAALTDALGEQASSTDDAAQICGVLAELARRDLVDPREALRRAIDRWTGGDVGAAEDELVEFDGVAGLLRVARSRGVAILGGAEEPDWPEEDAFVGRAAERLGEEAVNSALARAASTDAATYAAWIAAMRARDSTVSATTFGREASDEELGLAFEGLLATTDAAELRRHVGVFLRRTFPAFDERLLAPAAHEDDRVHHRTRHALGRLADARIRAFALPLFVGPPPGEDRVALLTALSASHLPGDHAAIEAALPATGDREFLRRIAGDVTNLAEAQADPALAGCLLWAYERSELAGGAAA